ncbi:MAG: 3-phosphoshikimate 1-carboxyvinyltransferase, partial [Simkaniaceae bacterium]|nr:3-phosphoshikimate 1-carboxyvinyltransferase [Simkaniaceae bacterium]
MTIPSSQSLSISPSLISGHFRAPPSKSQTLRALYFSLLAHNESRISHFLNASDTTHMIDAITKLGAHVCIEDDTLLVRSPGGIPQGTSDVINAGNSGIVYRFIAALAALIPTYTVITGDESIRTRRPIAPLLDALTHLGAFAKASNPLGHAPIIIRGPLTKHKTTIIGKDSQPVSSLIYAAAFAPHPIHISIQSLCEKPWIELSLSWLKSFGIPYQRETPSEITLFGKSKIDGFSYRVPGDFSSIAPLLVLAVIQNQSISIDNLDFDEAQGDQILIPLLQQMGANITIDPPNQRLQTFPHHGLQAITIDMDACIDLIPILA